MKRRYKNTAEPLKLAFALLGQSTSTARSAVCVALVLVKALALAFPKRMSRAAANTRVTLMHERAGVAGVVVTLAVTHSSLLSPAPPACMSSSILTATRATAPAGHKTRSDQ